MPTLPKCILRQLGGLFRKDLLPRALRPPRGLEFIVIKLVSYFAWILFLWKAFKTKLEPDGDFRLKLNTRMRIFCKGNFKGLCPSTTSLWKEKVLLELLN
jgi:hypothetical protein